MLFVSVNLYNDIAVNRFPSKLFYVDRDNRLSSNVL